MKNAAVALSNRWSAREENVLRGLYPRASWEDLRAALPRRSKRSIEGHATKLSIPRRSPGNRGNPAWTTTEVKMLKKLYGTAAWDDVCRALSRHTEGAIKIKSVQLALRRPAKSKLQSRYALIRQLRAVRRERRITRAQLADLIGCSVGSVPHWELGVCAPRFPTLLDWVQALGLELRLEKAQ